MTDFTHHLLVSAIMAEREQEAKAIARAARAASSPRGLRAGFATRLACLALRVDREAARFWLSRELGPPAADGSTS